MQGLEPSGIRSLYRPGNNSQPTRVHVAVVGRFALKKVVLTLRILMYPQKHKLDFYTPEGDAAGQHLGKIGHDL